MSRHDRAYLGVVVVVPIAKTGATTAALAGDWPRWWWGAQNFFPFCRRRAFTGGSPLWGIMPVRRHRAPLRYEPFGRLGKGKKVVLWKKSRSGRAASGGAPRAQELRPRISLNLKEIKIYFPYRKWSLLVKKSIIYVSLQVRSNDNNNYMLYTNINGDQSLMLI